MFKFKKKTKNKFKVFADDNYHSGGGGGDRYEIGTFDSLDEAIRKCEEFTIDSLSHFYEPDITPENLSAQWSLFGEDAFIRGASESVPFSARKFITTELCQSIIDARRSQ